MTVIDDDPGFTVRSQAGSGIADRAHPGSRPEERGHGTRKHGTTGHEQDGPWTDEVGQSRNGTGQGPCAYDLDADGHGASGPGGHGRDDAPEMHDAECCAPDDDIGDDDIGDEDLGEAPWETVMSDDAVLGAIREAVLEDLEDENQEDEGDQPGEKGNGDDPGVGAQAADRDQADTDEDGREFTAQDAGTPVGRDTNPDDSGADDMTEQLNQNVRLSLKAIAQAIAGSPEPADPDAREPETAGLERTGPEMTGPELTGPEAGNPEPAEFQAGLLDPDDPAMADEDVLTGQVSSVTGDDQTTLPAQQEQTLLADDQPDHDHDTDRVVAGETDRGEEAEDDEAPLEPVAIALEPAEAMRMVEAILFASAEPLNEVVLKERLPKNMDLRAILDDLQMLYSSRGVNLVQVAGKWAFRTATDLSFLLQKERIEPKKLSRAAIETLAIIAYHQPVTRAEIEQLRGVSVSKGTLDVLLEVGWARMRGRKQVPGRPITYGTTDAFLDHFGLATVTDLPGLEELKAAGLLDWRLPPDFSIPSPTKDGHGDGDGEVGEDDDDMEMDALEEDDDVLADQEGPEGVDGEEDSGGQEGPQTRSATG